MAHRYHDNFFPFLCATSIFTVISYCSPWNTLSFSDKPLFCRDKTIISITKLFFQWQNFILSWQYLFCMTKLFSFMTNSFFRWQSFFLYDKNFFPMTNCFCFMTKLFFIFRDKTSFIMRKLFLGRNKTFYSVYFFFPVTKLPCDITYFSSG